MQRERFFLHSSEKIREDAVEPDEGGDSPGDEREDHQGAADPPAEKDDEDAGQHQNYKEKQCGHDDLLIHDGIRPCRPG